jgi:hypothetical protein
MIPKVDFTTEWRNHSLSNFVLPAHSSNGRGKAPHGYCSIAAGEWAA